MYPSIVALIAAAEAHVRQLSHQADTEIYEPAPEGLKAEATRWKVTANNARAELAALRAIYEAAH